MKTFRDLIVWQRAMELVTLIYQLSKNFPKDELYGLTSQIRRTAVSIPANIAEGYGRRSTQDYLRFLHISMSSNYELQTLLEIACNLKYFSGASFEDAFEKSRELERMLSSLIMKINRNSTPA
jgi:four helix bundle protein